jgi:hypothetical protein
MLIVCTALTVIYTVFSVCIIVGLKMQVIQSCFQYVLITCAFLQKKQTGEKYKIEAQQRERSLSYQTLLILAYYW